MLNLFSGSNKLLGISGFSHDSVTQVISKLSLYRVCCKSASLLHRLRALKRQPRRLSCLLVLFECVEDEGSEITSLAEQSDVGRCQ